MSDGGAPALRVAELVLGGCLGSSGSLVYVEMESPEDADRLLRALGALTAEELPEGLCPAEEEEEKTT